MRSHRNCTHLQQLWVSYHGYFHITSLLVVCIFRNLRSLTANRHLLRPQIILFVWDFYSKMFAPKSLRAQGYLMKTGISSSTRTADLRDPHQRGGQEPENVCQLCYLTSCSRMEDCTSHECCPPTWATAPQQGGTQGQLRPRGQPFSLFFVMVIKRLSWEMRMWLFLSLKPCGSFFGNEQLRAGCKKHLHQARNVSTSPHVGNPDIHSPELGKN